MRLHRLALLLLATVCAVLAPTPLLHADPQTAELLTAFTALPESNPYRTVLLRYAELSPADRKAVSAWADHSDLHLTGESLPSLSSDQQALVIELATSLRAAASAPPASAEDWPLVPNPSDPDNPAAIILAGVGPIRQLARIATRHADELPPAEAIDTYAAIAQLGRQQRAGSTLIEQLNGVAIEGTAQSGPARRLAEFSADDLRRLSDTWQKLHATPDNTTAVSGERDLFFKPIVEKIIVPGLRDLLASGATGHESSPTEEKDSESFQDLRLSGLVDLGRNERFIILEDTRTGHSFKLRPGASNEGIELISLDFERRLAIIRRAAAEAVIHLESKRIVPAKSAGDRLREFFAGFDILNDEGTGQASLIEALARARTHPDGPEGYARELLAAYQAGIDRQIAAASSARYPDLEPTDAERSDPLLKLVMPTIGKLIRTFNGSATGHTMLHAAINHRLGQLQEGVDPLAHSDPWASGPDPVPFAVEPTPDGGFLLRSAYESAPGAPYTYKFAAPDAGFLRVPPRP
jgi:hypothetical protein